MTPRKEGLYMKVGLFIDTYHPKINGVITSVDALKSGLEKRGHDVYVITGGNRCKLDKDIFYLNSVNFNHWNCRIVNFLSDWNVENISKLNLDIIHSHSEFTVGLLANRVSKKLGIPNIHTYHTSYDDYKYYALKNIFGIGDYLENVLVDNYCRDGIDQLITPSDRIYEYLTSKFNVEKEKNIIKTGICPLDDGILNLNKSEVRKELGFEEDDFIILCVGRIALEKNLKLLIDAQMKFNVFNQKIKLVFIGDGPQLNELRMYIVRNSIENIHFIGKVLHEDIYRYYKMADITAVASRTETQGLSILESMQIGTPVICINDNAFDYIVDNNHNGIIFENMEDYFYKILAISEDKMKLFELGQNAMMTSSKYNDENYAFEVEKVYKRCRRTL